MATKKVITAELVDDLKRQEEYVAKQKSRPKAGMGLIFADAFLRGMRDLGYKSPATALDELVDNGIQASANHVTTVFSCKGKSGSKPQMLAVVDDGHGMVPDMIYYSVKWGGTHRENDRSGFGRYGYGLPSAAVSIAKRYTVYSKVTGGDWHAVTVDLEELAAKAESGEEVDVPQPRTARPPEFVLEQKEPFAVAKLESGTVVVLEDLDRLRKQTGWKTMNALRPRLLKHQGVTYRHIIPAPRLFVDGQEVKPVDPLFLMESGRFYDETEIMAQAVEAPSFEVETSTGEKGMVKIRVSWLPANFQAVDPKVAPGKAKTNQRFDVMKDHNGLLICRAGRQVDCLRTNPWSTFQNYDRNIKIEIDFDPALDEFYGITTSKQQIVIADDMWSRLEAAGVRKLIPDLRSKVGESRDRLEVEIQSAEQTGPRQSEEAMATSEKMKSTPTQPSPEKTKKAKEKLEAEAEKKSKQTGKPLEEVLEEIAAQVHACPYKVEFQAIPEGPFYRPDRIGLERRLIINTQHKFYSHLYNCPSSTPEIKAALEVLLFVLAEGELDVEGEYEAFYVSSRKNWSDRLANALKDLDPNDTIVDKASAMQEEAEVAAEAVRATESGA